MHTKVLNLACLCLLLPFLANAQRGLRIDADGNLYASPQTVAVNADLLAHYRTLGQLRNNESALRDGSFETLLTADKQQVYAFRRRAAGEKKGLVVVLNNSNKSQSV